MTESKFWMVKNITSGATSVKHSTIEEARIEAKRLALIDNCTFAILEAVEAYRAKPVEIEKLEVIKEPTIASN